MSFTEGFNAIESIKSSGQKLSNTVERIETLESKLQGLLQAHAQLESLIETITTAFVDIERSTRDLSEHYDSFTQQASSLPDQVALAIERAEERIKEHQATMTKALNGLPKLLDQAIEKKLQTKISDLETRVSDMLRDELKNTRQDLLNAMEVNARSLEGKLETASSDVIAEMPRTLLGIPLGKRPTTYAG
jgi:DNA repair exonuclease SbcCD ATPase subunit